MRLVNGTGRKPIHRLAKGVAGLLLLAVAGVLAAPWVVSQTSLGEPVLSAIRGELPAGSSFGQLSLSWFEPAGVTDLTFETDGIRLTAERARIDRPFWAFWSTDRPINLVTLADVRCEIDLNESLTTATAAEDRRPNRAEPRERERNVPAVQIERGQITLVNGPLKRPLTLDVQRIALGLADVEGSRSIEAAAVLVDDERNAVIQVEGSVAPVAGSGTIQAKVASLDLKSFSTLLSADVVASGVVDLTATTSWDRTAATMAVGLESEGLVIADTARSIETGATSAIGKGTYKFDDRALTLDTLKLVSEICTASAVGHWSFVDDVAIAAPRSRIDANLNLAEPLLRWIGAPQSVSVPSVALQDVTVRARESDGEIVAAGRLDYPIAHAYGLTSRDGTAGWIVTPEAAQIELVRVPIDQGRALGTYRIALSDPPVLAFAGGPSLENVTLTRELTRSWLRYVSPTVADSADLQGTFSLTHHLSRWRLKDDRSDCRELFRLHQPRRPPVRCSTN